MRLEKVRIIKVWEYTYKNEYQKAKHKNNMLLAKFEIEKESDLGIMFSQVIKESE